MNHPLPSRFHAASLACALALIVTNPARAGIPEPDTVIFGTIALDGQMVTAADTHVVVELRASPNGPVLTSYRMGSSAAAGNRYVLRVKSEHAAPLQEADAFLPGTTVHLSVRKAIEVRDSRAHILTTRGQFVAINFGDVDSDGDGMSDSFELEHFGNATAGDPDADSDADGRPNKREFLQGTDPLVADGRHPADLSPADDRLTIQEVTDYILAWKTGTAWPVEPALDAPDIIDYVTRAGTLWKGGEFYIFDNTPPTNAPMWWVNPPQGGPGAPALHGVSPPRRVSLAGPGQAGRIERILPTSYQPFESLRVSVAASPVDTTLAYAVVETPPENWIVRNVSHEGRWDAARRQIKWGPFFDTEPRSLSYDVIPLAGAANEAPFRGRGSFDGYGIEITGELRLQEFTVGPARLSLVGPGHQPGLAIEVRGVPGQRWTIEASENLHTWTPHQSLTLDAQGTARIPVPSDAPASQFFRLRVVD